MNAPVRKKAIKKIDKTIGVMRPHQCTISRVISCHGVGLHSGQNVRLLIKPAPADTGIRFFRSDLPVAPPIYAHMNRVVDTQLATTIGTKEFYISTIEHLMAAIRAFDIDNVDITVDSPEVPIMDGSAEPFFTLLQQAGKKLQKSYRRVLKVTRPISYNDGDTTIVISPYNGFKISSTIEFDAEIISRQQFSFDLYRDDFINKIGRARTFGYVEEVEELWSRGLAQGGNLNNVIAVHWDRKSVLNEDGLRYHNEFSRHKVLDLLGDITLLGIPILGHVQAYKAGHTQHLGLMKAIEAADQSWEVVEMKPNGEFSALSQMAKNTMKIGNTILPFFQAKNITMSTS